MSKPPIVPPLVAPDVNKSVPPKRTPPTLAPGVTAFVTGQGSSAQQRTGKEGA